MFENTFFLVQNINLRSQLLEFDIALWISINGKFKYSIILHSLRKNESFFLPELEPEKLYAFLRYCCYTDLVKKEKRCGVISS